MNGIKEAKIISRVTRKPKYKKVIWIVLVALVLQFAAVIALLAYSGYSDPEAETGYLLILGANVEGETLSVSLHERLKTGYAYLNKYPDTSVIVSGGQGRGEDISEAEAMRRYLVARGIDESRIIMETRATSTMENFRFASELIEQRTGKSAEGEKITFVTNRFHVFRSRLLAKRNGLNAHALASENPGVFEPMYLREYFALIKSVILDW